jgi:integrase
LDKAYRRNGHKDLTPEQVEALVKAARSNRQGLCDAFIINLAWHHGLRASELVDLRWSAAVSAVAVRAIHKTLQRRP